MDCQLEASNNDKEEMNEVYQKYFPQNMPARNCVAVAGIDDGLDIEIEVTAAVD